MSRVVLFVLLPVIAVVLSGCGGTTSGSTDTVNITSTRFSPQSTTITATNKVMWVNTDSNTHQVVSGVLQATSNPQLRTPVISINQNNSFTPSSFEANYGDTIQWQNNRLEPFVMSIVDASGIVRATLNFERSGQILTYSGFPSAGYYRYQQQGNTAIYGSLFLFGVPSPDGQFQSQPLSSGGSFSTQFNSPGKFNYYDLNQTNPNRSFRTGTVTVQ